LSSSGTSCHFAYARRAPFVAYATFSPFCGEIAPIGEGSYIDYERLQHFLRNKHKQCKAREGQKDEIDLVGHRGLLPEAVTQQCAREYAAKMRLTARSFVSWARSASQDDEMIVFLRYYVFFSVMLSGTKCSRNIYAQRAAPLR